MTGELTMTRKEVSRANIFSEISQKKITKAKAAEVLGLSTRHVRRLYTAYERNGLEGLVSGHTGKPSNHQIPSILKARVSELVTSQLYEGFGPTFMCEKLKEKHDITISVETTRQIMIQNGVWKAHRKKCPIIHQQRQRRACFGELIQIDGSPHAWFEDRGDPCTLIVFIDDATGHTYGKFFKSETTKAYMITTWEYITKYGRPRAFYPDKSTIFRINKPGCLKKELITQFGRACKELDIDLICANSPQAKGRVERSNQTQQDRLVKELRLAGISSIDEANKFLETYWEKYNEKFAVNPRREEDAHRKLLPEHDLERILCQKIQRTLTKNLELQHENVIYQIALEKPSWSMRGARVTVIRSLRGEVYIEYKGKNIPFKILAEQECNGEEVSSKEIDRFLKQKKEKKISHLHPWKQRERAEWKMRNYKCI